ncbi:hypothetical protein ES708_34038 [subsurface metagenome]
MTFQKRGRLTIARQKPIPTDPKTDLQLAQRQKYKDAVAAWNALTPEEKDAWRGVCPSLTSYQCFMRSELLYVEPAPPPEEKTEEQIVYDYAEKISIVYNQSVGQRLLIPNRNILKLGFWLQKYGTPTGDLFLEIRKVSPDSLILSKLWGDAADLSTDITYEEVTFDTPAVINEEARIYARFEGGVTVHCVKIQAKSLDIKPGEFITWYKNGDWTDYAAYDCAYRYKYYEVE